VVQAGKKAGERVTTVEGIEVALNPEELDLDTAAMQAKYEQTVREQQSQLEKEDLSDMVAEHAAKQQKVVADFGMALAHMIVVLVVVILITFLSLCSTAFAYVLIFVRHLVASTLGFHTSYLSVTNRIQHYESILCGLKDLRALKKWCIMEMVRNLTSKDKCH